MPDQGRNEGGTIPRTPNHYGGTEWLQGAPKSPNNVTSTFLKTVLFHSERLQVWKTGAPNLLLASDAM